MTFQNTSPFTVAFFTVNVCTSVGALGENPSAGDTGIGIEAIGFASDWFILLNVPVEMFSVSFPGGRMSEKSPCASVTFVMWGIPHAS